MYIVANQTHSQDRTPSAAPAAPDTWNPTPGTCLADPSNLNKWPLAST